jgi:hypothetical protein
MRALYAGVRPLHVQTVAWALYVLRTDNTTRVRGGYIRSGTPPHVEACDGDYPRAMSPQQATNDGAFMEPRGCKRWQSSANRGVAEAAATSQNRRRRLRPVA